jgi:putative acetyltransferase
MLRPFAAADLPEVSDLWIEAWGRAYPNIDFDARRAWLREHLNGLANEGTEIAVLVEDGRILGLVTVHPIAGYLDQLVVAASAQGRGVAGALLAHARTISPKRVSLKVNQDNAAAIRLYERHGFRIVTEDVNPGSGAPVYEMVWEPSV